MPGIESHVIHPYVFYLAYASDILNTISLVVAVFAIIALVSIYVEYRIAKDNYEKNSNNESVAEVYVNTRKSVHRVFMIFCVAILGVIIFPPKSVIYKMVASKFVTDNQIEITPSQLDAIVDKLVDQVKVKK